MKKTVSIIVVLLIVLAIIVTAVILLTKNQDKDNNDITETTTSETTTENIVPNVIYNTNLLINGDAEKGASDNDYGLGGWNDFDNIWLAVSEGEAYEGDYSFTPGRGAVNEAYLSQSVSLEDFKVGEWAILSALLRVKDESPADLASIELEFLDKDDEIISIIYSNQSNPVWAENKIYAQIPEGAVKANVNLYGSKNSKGDYEISTFYDNISLVVSDKVYTPVEIKADKNTSAAGGKVQLSVNCGDDSDPDNFTFRSSNERVATVDKNGKVTFKTNDNVQIFATHIESGVVGNYNFFKAN